MRRKQVLSLFMLVMGIALIVAATTVGAAGSATKKAGSAEANRGGTLRINEALADFDYVDPQLAVDCSMPRPRNDRPASPRMLEAMIRVE